MPFLEMAAGPHGSIAFYLAIKSGTCRALPLTSGSHIAKRNTEPFVLVDGLYLCEKCQFFCQSLRQHLNLEPVLAGDVSPVTVATTLGMRPPSGSLSDIKGSAIVRPDVAIHVEATRLLW